MFLTDLSIGEKYVFGFQVSVNEKIVMLQIKTKDDRKLLVYYLLSSVAEK